MSAVRHIRVRRVKSVADEMHRRLELVVDRLEDALPLLRREAVHRVDEDDRPTVGPQERRTGAPPQELGQPLPDDAWVRTSKRRRARRQLRLEVARDAL